MKLTLLAWVSIRFGVFLAQVGGGNNDNPWGGFAQLGASGILAGVLWLQLQKAEKRADTAEARTIAALQETVPVLALATERLSDKVAESKVTPTDVQIALMLEKIDKRLG